MPVWNWQEVRFKSLSLKGRLALGDPKMNLVARLWIPSTDWRSLAKEGVHASLAYPGKELTRLPKVECALNLEVEARISCSLLKTGHDCRIPPPSQFKLIYYCAFLVLQKDVRSRFQSNNGGVFCNCSETKHFVGLWTDGISVKIPFEGGVS